MNAACLVNSCSPKLSSQKLAREQHSLLAMFACLASSITLALSRLIGEPPVLFSPTA